MEIVVHHHPPTDRSTTTGATHRRSRPPTGFTLTETLTAVTLTGILVLAIVLSAFTLVRASGVSDRQANVEAVLGAAADELAEHGWTACPDEAATSYDDVVKQAASRVDWPVSAVRVESILHWDLASASWSSTNPFGAGGDCAMNPATAAATRMQLVTVRATAPGGGQSRTLDVVVADIALLEEQTDR